LLPLLVYFTNTLSFFHSFKFSVSFSEGLEKADKDLKENLRAAAKASPDKGSSTPPISHAAFPHTPNASVTRITRVRSINTRRYDGNNYDPHKYGVFQNKKMCFIIHPEKLVNYSRHFVIVWLCTFIALTIPYLVSFDERDDSAITSTQGWKAFAVTINVVFFLDLILSFFTAYFNREGFLVRDHKQIARKYLSTWFIVDLVSCFPFIATANTDFKTVASSIMLAKLLKIVKLEYNWQQTFHRHQFLRAKITRATITIGYCVIFMHWVACSWHALGAVEGVYTWLDDGAIRSESETTRYVASIYWVVMTLTSVGYGDYTAQSVSEQVFNVCIMLFGCVCYAFFIGRVSIFFIDFNQAKKMKQRALQHLESFMADANLDLELREKCRNATAARVEQVNLLVRAETCLQMLPSALQTEVMLQLHDKVIRNVEFLYDHRDIFPQFVAKAASLMQVPLKVRLGELLVQEGSVPEDCYFLVKGNAIIVRGGFPQMELHGGDFFGELECLLGSKRQASVYALSDCFLYTISAENLKYLFRKFPQAAAVLKDISMKKREDGIHLQNKKKALAGAIAGELGGDIHSHSPTGLGGSKNSNYRKASSGTGGEARGLNGGGGGKVPQPGELLKELQELRKENAGIRSLLARLEEHMVVGRPSSSRVVGSSSGGSSSSSSTNRETSSSDASKKERTATAPSSSKSKKGGGGGGASAL
jgi:hypothetical protein